MVVSPEKYGLVFTMPKGKVKVRKIRERDKKSWTQVWTQKKKKEKGGDSALLCP